FIAPAPSLIYTLSLHDALPILMLKAPGWEMSIVWYFFLGGIAGGAYFTAAIADNFGSLRDRSVARVGYLLSLPLVAICGVQYARSEEHTSELQSRFDLVCRLLL